MNKEQTKQWDGVVSQLKQQAEQRIESEPQVPPTIPASTQNDIERLASRLIAFPYEKLARATGYDPWRLDPDESVINGILVKNVVIYYLPFINLGKLSFWVFIGFNVVIIAMKTIEYRSFVKKLEEANKDKVETTEGGKNDSKGNKTGSVKTTSPTS